MTPVQVVGIGLEGASGLLPLVQEIVTQAAVLVGSDRHQDYFPDHPGERWGLDSLSQLAQRLQGRLALPDPGCIVVLTSGDPLFFGLGRWLLQVCPADVLTFHPHLSSVQLAFSRVKLPWQGAAVISAHGRSLEALGQALKQSTDPIAVLTDGIHTPGAIARLIEDLNLPTPYRFWVCENLGGTEERVRSLSLAAAQWETFAPLNVVILHRQTTPALDLPLPVLGIPDGAFLSFPDRPSLITKREIRLLILGELALQPGQVIWDIGAGTGSVSIEVARLATPCQVFAVEKTAIGAQLIRQNATRFQTSGITVIEGEAPMALATLPPPDRIFIGGSSGQLAPILVACAQHLSPGGRIVLALATLENLTEALQWLGKNPGWRSHLQQVQVSRSTAVGAYTRWNPLNPVMLITLSPAAPAVLDSNLERL